MTSSASGFKLRTPPKKSTKVPPVLIKNEVSRKWYLMKPVINMIYCLKVELRIIYECSENRFTRLARTASSSSERN